MSPHLHRRQDQRGDSGPTRTRQADQCRMPVRSTNVVILNYLRRLSRTLLASCCSVRRRAFCRKASTTGIPRAGPRRRAAPSRRRPNGQWSQAFLRSMLHRCGGHHGKTLRETPVMALAARADAIGNGQTAKRPGARQRAFSRQTFRRHRTAACVPERTNADALCPPSRATVTPEGAGAEAAMKADSHRESRERLGRPGCSRWLAWVSGAPVSQP